MKNPADRIFPILVLVAFLAIALIESYNYEEFLGMQLAYWKWIAWFNAGIVIVGWVVWMQLSEEDEEDE